MLFGAPYRAENTVLFHMELFKQQRVSTVTLLIQFCVVTKLKKIIIKKCNEMKLGKKVLHYLLSCSTFFIQM